MKKIFFLFLFLHVLSVACTNQIKNKAYLALDGTTQGTTYHITYESEGPQNYQVQIDSLLHQFDLSLSTYIPNSLISRINRNDSAVVCDKYFIEAFKKAQEISEKTDGAFDITVAPVVDVWGFGSGVKKEVSARQIDSLLQFVGYKKVSLQNNRIVKQNPNTMLNVNAIAQGYATDVIAAFFEEKGIKNYMVEIGGEVLAKGYNPKHVYWRIGIDKPIENSTEFDRQLQAVVKLDNKALSTSGNYRKFYEENGVKYSHTIDPKTGYPIRSKLLSATLMAPDCATADAYATACMVMGLEKSIKLVEGTPGLDAYFIYSDEKGAYKIYCTKGLQKMIVEGE